MVQTIALDKLNLDNVRRALASPRDGWAAQQRMSPRPRPGTRFPPFPESSVKQAGVLVLLYNNYDGLHFFLTRRTETVGTHKGQISLPGGAREEGESLEETAKRETVEELGLDPTNVEILGAPLTPLFIPASDFWVTPFVAFYHRIPELRIAQEEVLELISVPLAMLLDESFVFEEVREILGISVLVPYFEIQSHKVWGATAMILSELATMLRQEVERN